MAQSRTFSRDISWLSFNRRVLEEAQKPSVPTGERLKFLSIYSSNLDEFYRVRMPVLMAKQQLAMRRPSLRTDASEFDNARQIIQAQQQLFGHILTSQLIPLLAQENICWLYNQPMPEELSDVVRDYFFTSIAAFLQPVYITADTDFFPENSKLYLFAALEHAGEKLAVVNIPSDQLPRFLHIQHAGKQYIFMIDDIVKMHLAYVFAGAEVTGCYSFKITRDAELNLEDEFPDSLAEKIEKQVARRDLGSATRLLHQPGMPLRNLQLLCDLCKTSLNNAIEGGVYHNLKDIANLPLHNPRLFYPVQPPLPVQAAASALSLFEKILQGDIAVHSPYNSYGTVLRFFNEAAIDATVDEIYVTLYRIAADSRIAQALISAARNGKKVQVFVELKARFDEANNISWGKKMKEAGVKVTYSIPKLKVHAKIALVKKKAGKNTVYIGLLATGNLNESTAKFYTDHVLLTAHREMLFEMERLFVFLRKRKKPGQDDSLSFNHLLVAQFNLQQQFLAMIDREIAHAKQGFAAGIIIKLNNLEEQVMINKLYEASTAGVKVELIVRSICCLVPGVEGMSENITVKRIVGRYLEHGRVFIFHNKGDMKIFMGSADWMNRNIYTRIEVCFPVYSEAVKKDIHDIVQLQLQDNVQAVWIDQHLNNNPVGKQEHEPPVDSQAAIYEMLKSAGSHSNKPRSI